MSLSARPRAASSLLVLSTLACSSYTAATPGPDPVPGPTPPAREAPVTVSDAGLRSRMAAYAHDSMMGREAGTMGNFKATEYIAGELRNMGLEPAGDDGTFFQTVPMMTRVPVITVEVAGRTLELGTDILPLPPIENIPVSITGDLNGVEVIYAGRMGAPDEIGADAGQGKLVVIGAGMGPDGQPGFALGPSILKFGSAAGLAIANLDYAPSDLVAFLREPTAFVDDGATPVAVIPLTAFVSDATVESLFGESVETLQPGATGPALQGSFSFEDREPEAPARNVVAILRGIDPALRNQYVAIGAHNDHVGVNDHAADHDSLRAYLGVVRPKGADDDERPATDEEMVRVRATLDSLRAERPRSRLDSISNGADDDGSGSVTLLGIAEALAESTDRTRRSMLFVWHTAEEKGLFGAQHFTDNPTVPRDNIVAQLNMDMVGRGGVNDVPDGGPGYLQLIGSRRLSTELGDLVETINTEENHYFTFDYQFDADGHPQNFYCRSDHYMYARHGIPIVFFSTGGHRDYHQVTDEAQYIDYPKMARVGSFVQSVAEAVANLDHRVVVDKPKPNPDAPCQQ
jgi:hypothetical protein